MFRLNIKLKNYFIVYIYMSVINKKVYNKPKKENNNNKNTYYYNNKKRILNNQKRNRILKKYGAVDYINGEYVIPSYLKASL